MDPVPKTRVVLLIPTLDRSGAEKQFTLLATRLPRDEFDVRVITLTRGGPFETDLRAADIPVTVIGKRFRFDPLALLRLRDELRKNDPDILHTWLFAANAYGRLCAHSIPRAKVVVSERCIDSWKAGWQLWLDRRLIARTNQLVGNSQGVVDFYRELGVPNDKLVCIPNGIECDAPTLSESPHQAPNESQTLEQPGVTSLRRQIRDELQLPPNAFVVGFIGRLAKQKRVEDIIWAVETLRQIRPQLHLVIIGDGPERERLERFARDVQCWNNVRFLGHRNDATRYLAAFDVFCLASTFEGMSNGVMEAMAASLPVVASDIPPNRELVVPGETGFLYKPTDSVGIMQFVRRLIDEPHLAEEFGRSGRERICREFGIDRMVRSYSDLYRQLMGR